MAIETFGFIDDLNAANPTATDNVSEGDDHLRGLKTTLKNTFPNVTGAINATEAELNVIDMSSSGSTSGQVLTSNGTGTASSWQDIDSLPTQTGNAGKYLGTDGTTASWNTLDTDANSTTKGLYEHANTIAANYTIATGNNALTAGPITINTGVSVTVPTGSTWVVA